MLFSACSNHYTTDTYNFKASSSETTMMTTENNIIETNHASLNPTIDEDTVYSETKPIPTVPDDLNYYEMYKSVINSPHYQSARSDDSRLYECDDSYAKEWVSTDGKISFIMNTRYGPYGESRVKGKYNVDGNTYDINIVTGSEWFSVYIGGTPDALHTKILSGEFTYNYDEQSFTVTASKDYSAYIDEPDDMTSEEYNALHGDPTIPVYKLGEQVTFKMVR